GAHAVAPSWSATVPSTQGRHAVLPVPSALAVPGGHAPHAWEALGSSVQLVIASQRAAPPTHTPSTQVSPPVQAISSEQNPPSRGRHAPVSHRSHWSVHAR